MEALSVHINGGSPGQPLPIRMDKFTFREKEYPSQNVKERKDKKESPLKIRELFKYCFGVNVARLDYQVYLIPNATPQPKPELSPMKSHMGRTSRLSSMGAEFALKSYSIPI